MSNQEDFVSFEKALRDLQMRSEELRKLVSEGEIRAFRDGASMKFKREDIDALGDDAEDGFDLDDSFEDSLEDDTGMVTEELSDEDTLLVADDDEDLEGIGGDDIGGRDSMVTATTTRSSRVRAAAEDEVTSEPGWVTALAIVGAAVMFYGFMVIYSLASEPDVPTGFTTLLAF